MASLDDHIKLLKPKLEEKGWYVSCHKYYIGVTGYHNKKKTPNDIQKPRSQHIVSLNSFQNSSVEANTDSILYEVKTHWSVTRNIFTDLQPALDCFLKEVKNYNPAKLHWSRLGDCHIK